MPDNEIVQPSDDQDKSGGRPVGITSETFTPYIVNNTGGDLVLQAPSNNWGPDWAGVPPAIIANNQTGSFKSLGSLTTECSGNVTYTASAVNNAQFTLLWQVNPYIKNQISPSVGPGLKCVVGGGYGGWNPDPSFTISPS